MAFKNALKNFVAHFGPVWSFLLYIIIFAALITGLSLPFILPIAAAFSKAGVWEHLTGAFSSLFGDGGWNGLWEGLYETYHAAAGVLTDDSSVASLTVAFLVIVVVVAFRFFLGLYEIPMATVLDGRYSSNADYGFGAKFVSTLFVSARYSFAKMLYTSVFDALGVLIDYGLGKLIGMNMAYPFVLIFTVLILGAFRFSLVATWAPIVASGEAGIIKGFARSARLCFKRFGSFYSTYLISLLLIMAIGAFITIFTLGVGLIVVLPVSATYISYLNTTEFFNATGKRYYIDGMVFTPPLDGVYASQ